MPPRSDPTARPVPVEEVDAAIGLIRGERWAALSTVEPDGAPLGAMAAYAVARDWSAVYLHLSTLSRHTRNLFHDTRAALTIAMSDDGRSDPQTLARLTLMGQVKSLERDSQHYQRVRALYLRRLPESEQLFEFTDFVLFEMTPAAVHYVGGFVRAYHFDYQKVVDQIRR